MGDHAPRIIEALDLFPNVRGARFADHPDRALRGWIARGQSAYLVHDRDPLEHVAAAWVEFFDDQSTIGILDLEVDRAVDAFGTGEVSMPDYYVVVDPASLPPTWKHWWLGVLPQAAPTRVIPWETDGGTPLAGLLRGLPTSRMWPEPEPWLRRVARSVPDRIWLDGPATG